MYASNAVTHMLSGKAVQRALPGLFLVDSALNTMLVSKEFNVKPLCLRNKAEHKHANELSELQITSKPENPTPFISESLPTELDEISKLVEDLLSDKITVPDICQSEVLARVLQRLEKAKQSMQNLRTANLWLQFMKMMEILRKFLKGERMGIWNYIFRLCMKFFLI